MIHTSLFLHRFAARQRMAARNSWRHSLGMTLIEIMVVVAIISLIMGGFGVVAFQRFQEAQLKTARNQAVQQQQLVEQYMLQKRGKCPKTWDDLKSAGIAAKVVKDPWGNDFTLKCPGEHGSADVTSVGPDGEAGTEDDIRAWDEDSAEAEDEADNEQE